MGNQKEWEDILVVSTGAIVGKKVVKTIGLIQVSLARSMKNHQNKMKKKHSRWGQMQSLVIP